MVICSMHREDGLQYTSSPQRMTVISLIAIHGKAVKTCPLDSNRLHLIHKHRSCTVSVDYRQFFRLLSAHDRLQTAPSTFGFVRWSTDMEGIISDNAF